MFKWCWSPIVTSSTQATHRRTQLSLSESHCFEAFSNRPAPWSRLLICGVCWLTHEIRAKDERSCFTYHLRFAHPSIYIHHRFLPRIGIIILFIHKYTCIRTSSLAWRTICREADVSRGKNSLSPYPLPHKPTKACQAWLEPVSQWYPCHVISVSIMHSILWDHNSQSIYMSITTCWDNRHCTKKICVQKSHS